VEWYRRIGPPGEVARFVATSHPEKTPTMGSRLRTALDAADLDKVHASPLFAHLGEDVARIVIGDREPRAFERGRSIFLQGDPADAFFLVLDGWVKLFRAMPDEIGRASCRERVS
jgi:hypothetical protein